MLNYAAGVRFPLPVDPPIIIICLILVKTSGNALKKRHKLVNEPVFAQIILSGWVMIILWINWNDYSSTAFSGEWGISTPPSPSEPCMWVARSIYPLTSLLDPLTTGIFCFPMLYNRSKAFLVVLSRFVLPAEVEIPIRLSLSWWATSKMARASSRPGSQSSQIV